MGKNKELLRLGQFKQAAQPMEGGKTSIVAGVYNGGQRELAINIESSDNEGSIIHETGHAVDAEMGWSAGPEPAKPERGGWKIYGANYNNCANDMVDDSGGAIKTLTPAQRNDVINEMANSMGNRSVQNLEENISKLPWFGGLAAATRRAVLRDRSLNAIEIGLNQPWFKTEDGGENLGGHIYQEAYPNDWARYRQEARSRKVSQYQFRKSGEWFAEAYAFYYTPDPRGKGAKLADSDPDTKRYFDAHVDTRPASR